MLEVSNLKPLTEDQIIEAFAELRRLDFGFVLSTIGKDGYQLQLVFWTAPDTEMEVLTHRDLGQLIKNALRTAYLTIEWYEKSFDKAKSYLPRVE